MAKIELGPIGVALGPREGEHFTAALNELERLGYSTMATDSRDVFPVEQWRQLATALI